MTAIDTLDRRPQSQTRHRSALSAVESMLALVRVWRERRRIRRQLAAMSERELRDIGMYWSDIASETGKPFWRAFEAHLMR
jgi:uncharacterized protein YjiS (DUF1127 family)